MSISISELIEISQWVLILHYYETPKEYACQNNIVPVFKQKKI